MRTERGFRKRGRREKGEVVEERRVFRKGKRKWTGVELGKRVDKRERR